MKYLTVQDVMAKLGVTKAAVYRRLHGVQTGRHGWRQGPHQAWTELGAHYEQGRWWIPSPLVTQWQRQRKA